MNESIQNDGIKCFAYALIYIDIKAWMSIYNTQKTIQYSYWPQWKIMLVIEVSGVSTQKIMWGPLGGDTCTNGDPFLITWLNFLSNHPQWGVEWNYLSIPKLQKLHCWSLGIDESFHHTLYWMILLIHTIISDWMCQCSWQLLNYHSKHERTGPYKEVQIWWKKKWQVC